MPYVIAGPCIDVMDKSCTEECPVDCIYEAIASSISIPRNALTAAPASRYAPWKQSVRIVEYRRLT